MTWEPDSTDTPDIRDLGDDYLRPQRYLKMLLPQIAPAQTPGASTLGRARFWEDSPNPNSFDVTSSGVAGLGDTAQPQPDQRTDQPSAAAGKAIQERMPPPPTRRMDPMPQGPNVAAAPQGPPPSPVRQAPPPSSPDFQMPPPPGAVAGPEPGAAPPADYATQRQEQLLQERAQMPPIPKTSNWAQRIGTVLMGLTGLRPYTDMLLHPKWTAQETARERGISEIDSELGQLQKAESTSALAEQRRGMAQQRTALAADYSQRETERQAKIDADAEAKSRAEDTKRQLELDREDQMMLKGRDAFPLGPGEMPPEGWDLVNSVAHPGDRYAASPRFMRITPDLLPHMPGRKLNEPVGYDEWKRGQENAEKYKISQDKPLRPEQLSNVGLAIKAAGGDPMNPDSITQDVAQKAAAALQHQQPSIALTPEAVKFWATAASQGIPLPAMGMGASGAQARQQIINAAPQMAGGTPLVAGRAEQRADTASLQNMTKMRDSVNSFENTAGKNLDLFLNQAQKVVDSGSPWINQPLRAVAAQGLGSPDVAAYNAARQIALTEIAKVVNNPSLSSVLSDSARKEVTSLIPENATLKQIYRVAQILRQDMANRKTSLDQSLGEIKGRMGGTGTDGTGVGPKTADEYLRLIGHQQ